MRPAVRAVAALAALSVAVPLAVDSASAAPKQRCPVGQVRSGGDCVPYGGSTPAPTTTAPPPATEIGEYKFLFVLADGTVVRWDPCRPLRYATNFQGAPAFAAEILNGAIADVENATGIDFVSVGNTTEGRDGEPPAGADAIIGFSTPADYGASLEGAAGIGGASWVIPSSGSPYLLDGMALVNAAELATYTSDYGEQHGRDLLRTVFLHEIGHMVGLDHVSDPEQVMFPIAGALFYGTGDREGLRLLGRSQGCLQRAAGGTFAAGDTAVPAGTTAMVCQLDTSHRLDIRSTEPTRPFAA